jgi:hypothetical protein
MAGDGRFVVVWASAGATGGVLARRFDAAGVAAGDEFVVFDSGGQTLLGPVIAGARSGRFTISGTTGTSIFTQTYEADGTPSTAFTLGTSPDSGASTEADEPVVTMSNTLTMVGYVRERSFVVSSGTVYPDKVMLSVDGGPDFFADITGNEDHDQSSPAVASAPTGERAVLWFERNASVHSVRARVLGLAGRSVELSAGLSASATDPCAAMIAADIAAFGWVEAGAIELVVWTIDGSVVGDSVRRTVGGGQPALAAVPGGLVLAFAAGADVVVQRFDHRLEPVVRND